MTTANKKAIEFSQLFESMQEPCIVFDIDDPIFTIVAENDAHANMVMAKKETVIGKPVLEAFPDSRSDGVNSLTESLKEVLRSKQNHRMERLRYDIRDPDGNYIEKHWQIENYPLLDESGEVYAIFQNARDVSEEVANERRLAQIREQLGQSEESLRFMASTIPHLIWVTDPNGRGEYFNNRWYEYTGTLLSDVDFDQKELIYPKDVDRVMQAWQYAVEHGSPYEEEYRLYHAPTDSYRWVIARSEPYKNKSGEIVRWYGTCTDVDDRKHAIDVQAFLLDVSKKLSSTLEFDRILDEICNLCVPRIADWCSIDLLDQDETFEQVNVTHTDKKKISEAKEFRAHNPIQLTDPTGVGKVVRTNKIEFYPHVTNEMIEQGLSDAKSRSFMKSLGMRSIIIAPLTIKKQPIGAITLVTSDSGRIFSDDDVRLVEILSARISLAITNAQLYAESVQDLKVRKQLQNELVKEKQKLESRVKERTQQLQLTNEGLREEIIRRKKVESELGEYSENLARSNKELEDFAYVASHDLQEPLRKIQAFGDLLLDEHSGELGEDAKDYLSRLLNASVRMSTLIEDLLEFSRVSTRQRSIRKVDMNTVVNEVISDLQAGIDESGAKITVKNLSTVYASKTHMRQLLQNLIGNAIKFHQPGQPPVISVKTRRTKDFVEIHVKDNGIGFDEKYLDKIFNVFQRLNERKNYEGTGIGLAVCRKIVEKYNGTITANSKLGEGTTFVVQLPRVSKD